MLVCHKHINHGNLPVSCLLLQNGQANSMALELEIWNQSARLTGAGNAILGQRARLMHLFSPSNMRRAQAMLSSEVNDTASRLEQVSLICAGFLVRLSFVL